MRVGTTDNGLTSMLGAMNGISGVSVPALSQLSIAARTQIPTHDDSAALSKASTLAAQTAALPDVRDTATIHVLQSAIFAGTYQPSAGGVATAILHGMSVSEGLLR